jgi:hypothetical protein
MVLKLHQAELLDVSIIYGDGTKTAAKMGGDNIGFNEWNGNDSSELNREPPIGDTRPRKSAQASAPACHEIFPVQITLPRFGLAKPR